MISVVIPVHNRGKYLEQALKSVINQEAVDIEIIVVDDNSTEDLSPIASNYHCVYVKNKENKGAQYSRNKGVDLAKFPYIAFLDSDDVWHCTNKLKCQLDVISKNNQVKLVYTPLRFIDENDNIIQEALCDNSVEISQNALSFLLRKDFIRTYSSMMIRKSDFLFVGGCDEKLPARQDWDLCLRLAEKGAIAKDSRTSISYRMHSTQISSSGKKKLVGYMCILEKHFAKYHFDFKTKSAYYQNLIKLALLAGFVGGGDKNQLPDIDKFLIRFVSKLTLICRVPLIGHLFFKLLKRTYLFAGLHLTDLL